MDVRVAKTAEWKFVKSYCRMNALSRGPQAKSLYSITVRHLYKLQGSVLYLGVGVGQVHVEGLEDGQLVHLAPVHSVRCSLSCENLWVA